MSTPGEVPVLAPFGHWPDGLSEQLIDQLIAEVDARHKPVVTAARADGSAATRRWDRTERRADVGHALGVPDADTGAEWRANAVA